MLFTRIKEYSLPRKECSDIRERLHSDHSLRAFVTDHERLVFEVQVNENPSEKLQNDDNKIKQIQLSIFRTKQIQLRKDLV